MSRTVDQRWLEDFRAKARWLRGGWVIAPGYVLFVAVNIMHNYARAYADDIAPFAPQNTSVFDRVLLGAYPTVWLQDVLGTDSVVSVLGFYVWQTLFYIPILLVAYVLLVYGRGLFLRLLLLHAALVLSADLIYAIAPTKPPWMDIGVSRIIEIQLGNGTRLDHNPFAALPSLHVAVPFAYALWFARRKDARSPWLGPVLVIWASAIAWAVVYTGEHYLIDVVTGFIWAAAVYLVLERLGLSARGSRRAQLPSGVPLDAVSPHLHGRPPQPAPSVEPLGSTNQAA
ncbi:MAG: phosphatase PAP2 family protein [Dehalococcoidia bacterium]